MLKRLILVISLVVAVALGVVTYARWDVRAIEMRREKASELDRTADRLSNADMQAVLKELGSPTTVQVHETGASATNPTAPKNVLLFTYEYTFSAAPWTSPQRVWITFRFNVDGTRVTSASVDQTFSSS